MKKPADPRGVVLISVLVVAALLALVAQSVAWLAYGDIVIFRAMAGRQDGQWAAAAGLYELNACLYGQTYPPPQRQSCQTDLGWSNWSAQGPGYQSMKTRQVGLQTFQLTASWAEGGALIVSADPAG